MSYNPFDPKDLINPTKLENYINPLSPYGPKNHLFDDDDDDDDCSVENAIGVFFFSTNYIPHSSDAYNDSNFIILKIFFFFERQEYETKFLRNGQRI